MDYCALRRLLDGSLVLEAAEFTTLSRASELTGLAVAELLREAAVGRLALYCHVPSGSRYGRMATQ